MKTWYIFKDDKQQGPFTLHQLIAQQINPSIPVWTEGFTQWIKAKEVPELQPIFAKSSLRLAASPTASNAYPAGQPTTEYVGFIFDKRWRIGLAIAAITLTVFLVARAQHPGAERGNADKTVSQSPEQLRAALKQKEMIKPAHHLYGKLKHRKNATGETLLEGAVENRASLASFKDVVLKVTWLSKTNAEITITRHTIYELIAAGQTVPFTLKTLGPAGYAGMIAEIESATAAP